MSASASTSVSAVTRSTQVADQNASDDARLMSNATATAAVAVRSILSSGGNEDTALKTAKAAAQSVLLQNSTYPGVLRRRKIKRKSNIIASMALANAIFERGEGIPNGSTGSVAAGDPEKVQQKLRQLQTELDQVDDRSLATGMSSSYSILHKHPRRTRSRLPFRSLKKGLSTIVGSGSMSAISEYSHQPPRPVNITVERQSSPNEEHERQEAKPVVKKQTLEKSELKRMTSKIHVVSPSKRSHHEPMASLSADDPIYYYMDAQVDSDPSENSRNLYLESSSEADEQEEADLMTYTESVSSELSQGTGTTGPSHRSMKSHRSFIAHSIDPCLIGFGELWQCGGLLNRNADKAHERKKPSRQARPGVSQSLSDVSSVFSDELVRGLHSGVAGSKERRDGPSMKPVASPDTREGMEKVAEGGSSSQKGITKKEKKAGKSRWSRIRKSVAKPRKMKDRASPLVQAE